MPLRRTAQLLGFDRDLAVGKRRLRATTQARLVMEMVQRFCWSTDEQVAARHLGRVNGLDDAGVQYLAEVLLRRHGGRGTTSARHAGCFRSSMTTT